MKNDPVDETRADNLNVLPRIGFLLTRLCRGRRGAQEEENSRPSELADHVLTFCD
jgi:hypothetical protein